MRLIIHCGLDKAGSTAIQAHVALFRSWLLRNGVYLPATGLSGIGHVALFNDLSVGNWQPLLDELGGLDQAEFARCFFSFEGICKFDEQKLGIISEYLADYEVTVLFYLREQAEILQSGYLQQLKSAKHALSIAHLNSDHSLLVPASRNYFDMLRKFESVFGTENIAVRLYEPGRWRNGSIIWDLLEFLDCPPDSDFTPAAQRQNISLDLQSAAILNVFDSYLGNAAGRSALVEDLLCLIQKHPGGGHYFLDEGAVRHIRNNYRSSNSLLAERYGAEFDYQPCAAQVTDEGNDGSVSYVRELAALARYPRWQGELVEGPALETLLGHLSGWSRFEKWGVWSLGDVSSLEFRVPLARINGIEDSLTLTFSGHYFADNGSTQISICGSPLGDFDLRDGTVKIPIGLLDENRVLKLELRHCAAVSPADLDLGNDKRRLAYGLQGLRYQLGV